MEPERALEDRLKSVLVHGQQRAFVEVVDYDPSWPGRYDFYAEGLREMLGDRLLLIEHIGSTSVPGLAAKPVIDMVIGVADPDDEDAYIPDLVANGYDLRVREPGHRCLRGGDPQLRVNLHCYQPDSIEVERYVRLRDWLRADEDDRELYAETKRRLAGREWPDVNFYAEAKGPVIREILRRAGDSTVEQ